MKTKLLALLLAFLMCLSLTACGASDPGASSDASAPDTSTKPSESETTEQETETDSETGKVEQTEEENISVTIPASLFQPEEVEGTIGDATSGNYESLTVNEDGSTTVVMTPEQHEQVMGIIKEAMDNTVAESFPDENFPSVKSMECSDDYTEVTMTVDYAAYENSFDSLMEYLGIMACSMYQMFDGVDSESIVISVSVVDEASGTVEYTKQYPDDYDNYEDALGLTEESSTELEETGAMEGSGDLGDYHVEIVDATLGTDYEGNDAIIIKITWTNNSEETTNFTSVFLCQAFQNGIEMDDTYVESDLENNGFKDIRPGTTLDVEVAYLITGDSTVEFEISDWFSYEGSMVCMDFDPTTLQ